MMQQKIAEMEKMSQAKKLHETQNSRQGSQYIR
jgi:hypothetical protein